MDLIYNVTTGEFTDPEHGGRIEGDLYFHLDQECLFLHAHRRQEPEGWEDDPQTWNRYGWREEDTIYRLQEDPEISYGDTMRWYCGEELSDWDYTGQARRIAGGLVPVTLGRGLKEWRGTPWGDRHRLGFEDTTHLYEKQEAKTACWREDGF